MSTATSSTLANSDLEFPFPEFARSKSPSSKCAQAKSHFPPPPPPPKSLRTEITLSLRSKIRALHTFAQWTFRHIATTVELPVSTVFAICAQPNTPTQHRTGRPCRLSLEEKSQLVAHATASQENRRKSLFTIAEELGVRVNERTLRRFFASQGYHRRIARVKPFLTAKSKITRLQFADTFHQWSQQDWYKVIWTDECAFNVGAFPEILG